MQLAEKIENICKEVELFIQYGVQEQEQQEALELLIKYSNDLLVLQVMKAFYSSLPESREEAISRIAVIEKKEDIFLLTLSTASHNYLYLATEQKAVLLGQYGQEIMEPDMLALFGYPDAKVFFSKYPDPERCQEYESMRDAGSNFCPVCSTAVGEYHLLGCSVEVCPWCEGQFSRCGCRFEQLGLEVLEDEEELEELERILQAKGRIAYAPEQCPSYPSATDEQDGH